MFNKKEKELLQREIDLYKKEEFAKVDRMVDEHKSQRNKEIYELALRCATDIGNNEHNFHSTKEKLGIEIAKLEAKKENLSLDKDVYEKILKEKTDEINRLNTIILEMIKNQSNVTIKK